MIDFIRNNTPRLSRYNDDVKRMVEIAEMSLIATVLNMDTVNEAAACTSPEWFINVSHAAIWKAMLEHDCTSVADLIRMSSSFTGKTAEAYLTITEANLYSYPEKSWQELKDETDKLKKRQELGNAATSLQYGSATTEEINQWFEQLRAEQESSFQKKQTTKSHAHDFMNAIVGRISGEFSGVDTGFPMWDDCTCGLAPGTLNMLAARPKIGKTAMALQIAWHIAVSGGRVLYISTEMAGNAIMSRLVSSITGIPSVKILKGITLTPTEIEQVSSAAGMIGLSDRFLLYVLIGADAKRITATMKSVGEVGAVVVDQLQGMHFGNRNRVQEIGDATKAIRSAGEQLNTSVLMLCQLSRGLEARESGKPNLADLRDSGEIEQDCDTATFLWKKKNGGNDRYMTLAANRHGPQMECKLGFDPIHTRFFETKTPSEGYDES